MKKTDSRKHVNYELLNLLGYGLAKFDNEFVKQFSFEAKTAFYEYIVNLGICDTVGAVKNRQDMLDPFFDNGRRGWWQHKSQYISRKLFIDSLFENENVQSFSDIVKMYINKDFKIDVPFEKKISPVVKSKFKQLQETGIEAELYFYHNYNSLNIFKNGIILDARLFGDGYDFQIEVDNSFFLAEVKGVRLTAGSIRITKNEYEKAFEYKKNILLLLLVIWLNHQKLLLLKTL
ncbi:MAG: protein NO VEIN domain-containing protein [Candidatus Scalindua sp.]